MNGYFITGTDTGVGKTNVTAALLRCFLDAGHNALAIKPIQTGCRKTVDGFIAEDVETYAQFTESYFPKGYPDACCRKFHPACSPHLAAQLVEEELDVEKLTYDIKQLSADKQLVLVEGAGGALVPLGQGETLLDLMERLALPVILVADNRLGVVNHALMTVKAIRERGLTLAGIVMTNTSPVQDDAYLRQNNIETIAEYGDVSILAEIPYFTREKRAISIIHHTKKIVAALEKKTTDDIDCVKAEVDFDQRYIWHPYTSALNPLPSVKVHGTRGTKIILEDGAELIDGMASWWCAIHGYGHPKLKSALRFQLGRMSHVMFGGLTHDPAIKLCRNLQKMTPNGLDHVFLADSGSVSVEVAIKMALQYMQADGQKKRTKLFTIRGGYHGDTSGAMSVCDPTGGMHHLFSSLLPQQIFASRPSCGFDDEFFPACLDEAREIISKHEAELAAIILEPIVQGAGGMYFYHPQYLSGLRALANEFGILLILDEIATGFGRTGKLFACEWSDVIPDIMCVGKALTGGTMTLAATLATHEVAATISRDGGVFMHGPTFMANPLACAVANASLEILQTTNWADLVNNIEGWLKEALTPCRRLSAVKDVRVLGAIGVVELNSTVDVEKLQSFFIKRGVWLRPFGKLIYTMPPYTMSHDEIKTLGTAIFDAISTNAHVEGN